MSTNTDIPVLTSVAALRAWRRQQMMRSVGFVPTMGALHDGHVDLVRRSLAHNDSTVLSIFVNPAQFAPHEDLSTYPKTFDSDMAKFRTALAEAEPNPTRSAVVFLPSLQEMYPSGIVQNVQDQKGTFVEVKGYGHQMEGKTRPTFFRGVATIVTKLFNAVEPTRAYFGQKDIQQALILRRLASDLLLSHPTPDNLLIVPTHRASADGLALSSRNAYLTSKEREHAGTLYAALKLASRSWEGQLGTPISPKEAIGRAVQFVRGRAEEALANDGVYLELDYIELTDPETFEPIQWEHANAPNSTVIVSGALVVGKTRLIDNVICGDTSRILSV